MRKPKDHTEFTRTRLQDDPDLFGICDSGHDFLKPLTGHMAFLIKVTRTMIRGLREFFHKFEA